MSRAASSISWSRRGALGGAAGLLLGGCGFRPMYGPVGEGSGQSDIAADLAAVRVGYMGERFGVLMRRTLQRRFEGQAPGTQARYTLDVNYGLSAEVLGYRSDGTISRLRYIGTSNWNLMTLAVPPQTIARSVMPIRTIDAFNVPDLQFFSADTSRDDMERRLTQALSDEVYRQVVLAMRKYIANGRKVAAAGGAMDAARG